MKISIVVPVYNGSLYIEKTLKSIFSQSYRNFEVIVMDGGSVDGTQDIVKNNFPSALLVSERDNGQANAINNGFKLATGDILAWQNADDVYMKDAFTNVIAFFEEKQDISLIYGNYQMIDKNDKLISSVYPPKWNDFLFSHGRFCPVQPTVFWKRSVYEKNGVLNENLNFCMDVDFYCRTMSKFKIEKINKILGQFRIHEESKTQNSTNAAALKKEYFNVLSSNFNFNYFDIICFEFFHFRAKVTSFVNNEILSKFK